MNIITRGYIFITFSYLISSFILRKKSGQEGMLLLFTEYLVQEEIYIWNFYMKGFSIFWILEKYFDRYFLIMLWSLGSCEFIAAKMNIQVCVRNWCKFLNFWTFLHVKSRDESPEQRTVWGVKEHSNTYSFWGWKNISHLYKNTEVKMVDKKTWFQINDGIPVLT